MALIVFTHGLSGSIQSWGSTIDVLRDHERLANHEIRAWEYRTNKRPRLRLGRDLYQVLRGWRYQSIIELGEQIWSHLRSWSADHDEIVLVGHSMGGLVTAAAVVYGFDSDEDRDMVLFNKLRGFIFIATPFAGASSSEKLDRLYKTWADNGHISDLSPKSKVRRKVVQDFTRVLNNRPLTMMLMRAAEDAIVSPGEITREFSRSQYHEDVLDGTHAECIHDLSIDNENLKKLMTAVDEILSVNEHVLDDDLLKLFRSRSVTIRREYDDRLDRMEEHLDVLAWGLASFREDYGDKVVDWVDRGIKIRLLLVDANSDTGAMLCELQDRFEDRDTGSTESDIRRFLAEVDPVDSRYEIRVSCFHPGVNIFRVDQDMFFGPYLAGTVSRNAPTGIVSSGHWLYDSLLSHFEWMWDQSPVWEPPSDSEPM